MGVTMCSEARTGTRQNMSYQFTEKWHLEEERSDSEEESLSFSKARKSKSLPKNFGSDTGKFSPMVRAKTERVSRVRGYSLKDRMKERRRPSAVSSEGEQLAREYAKMVTDDTLEHIYNSVRVATSIVQKSTDINEELGRQERVLSKADNDISTAEYETGQVSHILEGMGSLTGKFTRSIFKRKSKRLAKVSSEVNFDLLNGHSGLCALSRMGSFKSSYSPIESSKDAQQQKIKMGIGHLHNALDAITVQQLDTSWALERQEERLSVFEDKMDTTHKKINRQSQTLRKIMGKS